MSIPSQCVKLILVSEVVKARYLKSAMLHFTFANNTNYSTWQQRRRILLIQPTRCPGSLRVGSTVHVQ